MLIAVDDTIPCISIPSPPGIEVIVIKVYLPKKSLSLFSVYVPPTSGDNYFIHLIAYLKVFEAHEESFIIVGDFYLPDIICWESLSGGTFHSKLLCDFVFEYDLLQ